MSDPTKIIPVRRALISVSDKTGLIPFAEALARAGAEILSTGGTARALREAGLTVIEVSDHTGFPEIMDGRVKTLVPQIHGGILGRRDLPEHVSQMQAHGIAPIDLVAVNLYPFEATVAAGADAETTIENIDIGGPALIRAAAKNHDFVTVLTDPAQYAEVAAALAGGGTPIDLRRRLAGAAYARTAAYDAAIAAWFAEQRQESFPERFTISGQLRQTLRYGENPHQHAAFYVTGNRPGVATAGRSRARNSPTTTSTTPTPPSNASPNSRTRPSSSSSTPTPAASPPPALSPPPGMRRSPATRSAPSAASSR